jgi:threonine dehydrogenase-like Zn-dependent dehydrogenase
VAKAWETILHIGSRSRWEPHRALITGAGPVGLLAALLATRQGSEVHVLDRVVEGPKPDLVRDLGAIYHGDGLGEIDGDFDVVVECTGSPELAVAVTGRLAPNGIVCQTGVFADDHAAFTSDLMRSLVLRNQTMFGTVNANRRHYVEAARVLAETDRSWLERLVDRRVTVDQGAEAYEWRPNDVKTAIEFE